MVWGWSTGHKRKGQESWACSCWRSEGKGYLTRKCREDGGRLSLDVHREMTEGNEDKFEHWKFHLGVRKTFFVVRDVKCLSFGSLSLEVLKIHLVKSISNMV